MTNRDYIKMYEGKDDILASYYQLKNRKGPSGIIKGIINPLEIDNTNICAPTDDQSTTPHCAGFSTAQYLEAIHWKKTGKLINLDAHQIYALSKQKDGMIDAEGTLLETALQAGIQLCKLKDVTIKSFTTDKTQKTIETLKHIIHKYDLCLIGCNICTGWYSCNIQDPVIKHTNQSLGGHAILCCGYDKTGFIIQNHWSPSWGAKGFACIPYDVFLKEFLCASWITNLYDNVD